MKGPLFYAKILLFGEYGIIKDSKGLSIPYNFYRGALKLNAPATFEDSHDKGNRKEKVDLAAKDHRCHTDLALQRSQRDRIHTNGICRGPELVDAQRCFARPECALC